MQTLANACNAFRLAKKEGITCPPIVARDAVDNSQIPLTGKALNGAAATGMQNADVTHMRQLDNGRRPHVKDLHIRQRCITIKRGL
jgi:hypothetical protein